jgi:uncharacterized membrane protein
VTRLVWLAAGLFALVMTALGADRYATYHSGADLGEFVQTIATPLSGFGDNPEGGSHFLHHFSPLLYLFSPLLLALHTPLVLVALQACAVALTAPGLFLLARRHMDERLAAFAACVALLYPPLVGVAFTDFHENGFAPAAIVWLAWALDARRFALAGLFAAAALAIKEDEALVLAVLGAGYAIFSARRGDARAARFGAAATVCALLVFAAYFAIVRPLAGAHGAWFALDYFAGHSFDTPHGAAIVLGRVSFLLEAFVPLLFVPLASPAALLVVPGLVEVLASRWSITYTMGQHYAGVWAGEMLVAFAFGLARIARERPAVAPALARGALAVCALVLVVASPTHWAHYLRARDAHDAALDALVARVPPHASVATYDEVYSHLGFDRAAQIGFAPDPEPEYALFDPAYDGAGWRTIYAPRFAQLLREGRYRPLYSAGGATLYRRIAGMHARRPARTLAFTWIR